jgi:hypothetical protein
MIPRTRAVAPHFKLSSMLLPRLSRRFLTSTTTRYPTLPLLTQHSSYPLSPLTSSTSSPSSRSLLQHNLTARSSSRLFTSSKRLRAEEATTNIAQEGLNMEAKELAQYLADSPPSAVRLEIAKHFEALDDRQKEYAHWISRYDLPLTMS